MGYSLWFNVWYVNQIEFKKYISVLVRLINYIKLVFTLDNIDTTSWGINDPCIYMTWLNVHPDIFMNKSWNFSI